MSTLIKIYPEPWAWLNVERSGQKYRPGNGTEGAIFCDAWCGQCARDHGMLHGLPLEDCDDNQVCPIIGDSYLYQVDHPSYPAQWQYGPDGQPRCTDFVPDGSPIPPPPDTASGDLFPPPGAEE